MAETNGTKTYGLFVGILAACVLLLFGLVLLTRTSWQNGLRSQAQVVLDRVYPGEYRMSAFIPLNSSFAASAAVFELLTPERIVSSLLGTDANVVQKQYGIILKVPTLFGPLPGVFVSDSMGIVHFAGFAFRFARFESTFSKSLFYPRVSQLERRVQTLLGEINER
jgi:hypothetical protein